MEPSLLSKLAVAFYCFTFGSFTWVWVTLLVGAYHHPSLVVPPIVAWLAYVLLVDYDARNTGWTPSCRNLSVWRHMRSYFSSTELVMLGSNGRGSGGDAAARPGPGPGPRPRREEDAGGAGEHEEKPNLFLYHPHGVLAFGSWLAFGCNALGMDDRLRKPPRLVTLNVNFFAPFLREFLLAHGVCSCAKRALVGLLRRNESVALVVGGGSESLLSKQGTYDLVLRRRRGFAKVALETGCNLVPVVGFGETDAYSTWNDWKLVRAIQQRIERTLGFTVPIAVGRGFFLPWGLLPHSCTLRVVTGRPVPVDKWTGGGGAKDESYERAIEDVKRRYEAALLEVFAREGVNCVRIVE